jgi:hypothetical protein
MGRVYIYVHTKRNVQISFWDFYGTVRHLTADCRLIGRYIVYTWLQGFTIGRNHIESQHVFISYYIIIMASVPYINTTAEPYRTVPYRSTPWLFKTPVRPLYPKSLLLVRLFVNPLDIPFFPIHLAVRLAGKLAKRHDIGVAHWIETCATFITERRLQISP